MHKPYDITMKMLMEQEPVAWLRRFGIEPDDPVSVVPSEVSTITSEVDKVFKIDGAEPYLVHIENQTSPDPDMPWRMNRYNVFVAKDGEYPVLSVLVLLRRSAEAKDLTGVHERKVPGFGLVSLFHYPIVRVWELDVESILIGELSILPLAPPADVPEESIPDVFRRIDERVMRDGNADGVYDHGIDPAPGGDAIGTRSNPRHDEEVFINEPFAGIFILSDVA